MGMSLASVRFRANVELGIGLCSGSKYIVYISCDDRCRILSVFLDF